MRFGEPVYLWALIAVPALLVFFLLAERLRLKARSEFANLRLFALLAENFSPRRARWKKILLVSSLFLVALCLARPQWGSQLVEIKKQGVDIIFALDVSLSMLAEDILPNRLERAKLEVADFLKKLQGDRVGLVAFAGGAYIFCPLTLDYRAAQLFLDNLQPGVISKPGTNLAEAIHTAGLAFNQKEKEFKVLILVTDGEDQGHQPLAAAQEAVKEGVKIYTIGIGTPAGEPIPLRDQNGNFLGYKKDEAGAVVLSRLDEKTLSEIAQIGKGRFISPARGDFDLDKTYQEISGMQKKELKGTLAVQYIDRYQYFLFLAIVLLGMDTFMTERRQKSVWLKSLVRKERVGAAALLLIFLFPSPTEAKKNPASLNSEGNKLYKEGKYQEAAEAYQNAAVENPEAFPLQYNLANALQQAGDFSQALDIYQRALGLADPGKLGQTFYNLGNNLFRAQAYDQAAAAYRKALGTNPADRDAKFNYELALKKMQEQKSQPQQKKQKQQKQKEQPNQSSQKNQSDQKQKEQKQDNSQEKDSQKDQDQSRKDSKDQTKPQPEPQPSQSQLNQEEAERILEALSQKEKEKNQQKLKEMQKALLKQSKQGKDW